MRRGLRILLSGIALFSLVSCVNDDTEGPETRTRYKVTFLNYDDTFLYETMVFEGKTAYYSGELPKRVVEGDENGDGDFEYKFTGWEYSDGKDDFEKVIQKTLDFKIRDKEYPTLYSFDIFDTALLRKVEFPTDVFHVLGIEMGINNFKFNSDVDCLNYSHNTAISS